MRTRLDDYNEKENIKYKKKSSFVSTSFYNGILENVKRVPKMEDWERL
jgi:hypothetical protein